MELGGALARTTWLPPRANDRRDGIDEREQLRCVVRVGFGKPNVQWDAAAVDDEVVLRSRLTAVHRIAPGLLAPLLARTLTLSRLARFQSMAAASPNQLRRVSCSWCQTPASCQSRSRRQHVVPLPQPSSRGSSRQGQPVRKTKTMPPSAARCRTLGRPPFSWASPSATGVRWLPRGRRGQGMTRSWLAIMPLPVGF